MLRQKGDEPDTLDLKIRCKGFSTKKNIYMIAFTKSRMVLESRRKQLTKLGKGNKPHATRAISDQEIDILYKNNYFGYDNPENLQRTLWWMIINQFGYRARDEARQLTWGDINLNIDLVHKEEFISWNTERSTRTRNGERPMGHKCVFHPKAFSNDDDLQRCPVHFYKRFVCLCRRSYLKYLGQGKSFFFFVDILAG